MKPHDLTYIWSKQSNIQYGIEFPPGFLQESGMDDPGYVRFDPAEVRPEGDHLLIFLNFQFSGGGVDNS